ncbi:MAG: hypothetical protein KBC84_08520, partial [Proteobacteria bacterium]|nr:hypothetical protein [Pseudomonadota bacterium]
MSPPKENVAAIHKDLRMPSVQGIEQDRELKLPRSLSREEEQSDRKEQARANEVERYRQENLGALGRLKERTLGAALTLTCNTGELLAMVGLSLYSEIPHQLGITRLLGISEEQVREHQVNRLNLYQKFFDEVSPNGSIQSGKDPLFSESTAGTAFNIFKHAFGVVTYPTTLLINVAIGGIGTIVEELDRKYNYKGISYSQYLKEVEENPSEFRDAANLGLFVAVSFLTVGKGRVPMNMATRCQNALMRMVPSVGMGTAGALGEQLMRVGDEQSGGFNFRILARDAIQGWLSSSLFS